MTARFLDRRPRPLLLALIVALHLGAILLLLRAAPRAPRLQAHAQGTLSVFDVGPDPAPPAPVEPAEVDTSRSPIVTVAVQPPMVVPAAPAASGGGGCDVGAAVQQALRNDPAALAEIAAIPPERRSVANAVIVWDGRTSIDPAGIAARPAVAAQLRAILGGLPDACLAESQNGPTLLFIPVDGATSTLVVGSGRWRWRNFSEALHPIAE